MNCDYEIIECCPNCGSEINLRVKPNTKVIPYCPFCGECNVILCSECMDHIGDCDRNNPQAFCYKEDK